MSFVKNLFLGLCLFCLTTLVFAQENLSFELCELITSQEDSRILKGLDNWLFSRTDLISDIAITDEALLRLKELKAALDYRDIEIVFVLLPSRAMMHYDKFDLSQERFKNFDLQQAIESYENALAVLNDVGFYAPNVYEYLLENAQDEAYAFKRDSHWLPSSAEYTAKLVEETLREKVTYKELIHTDFEVELEAVVDRYSDLARAVNIQCDTAIPPEPQESFKIVASENQSELLFDTDASVVPLWGTSYSRTSNFAEFLQAELDVEIANYAYGAAGLWRSLRQYFLELDESDSKAELSIWEIPYGYFEEFNFLNLYQEMIPTIYGSCEGDLEVMPLVTQPINGSPAINLFNDSATKFENDSWTPVRLDNIQYEVSEDLLPAETAAKLIFNGEKDPWLSYRLETNESLAGEFYEFSVWLWTDENQPKKAALYMYSGKENVSIENITLGTEPQLYTVFHGFSETTEKTAMTLRIDGIQGQWSANSKGQYIYAALPVFYKSDPIELFNDMNSNIQSDDYYIQINFTDKSIVDYQLKSEFADGRSINLDIMRDEYTANNGSYVYELASANDAFLSELYLRGLPSTSYGEVSARICKKP